MRSSYSQKGRQEDNQIGPGSDRERSPSPEIPLRQRFSPRRVSILTAPSAGSSFADAQKVFVANSGRGLNLHIHLALVGHYLALSSKLALVFY